MVIDLIIGRKEGLNVDFSITKGGRVYSTPEYKPKVFYNNLMSYYNTFSDIVEPIAEAMDNGEEVDVKRELCRYILEQDYNKGLCDYIESVTWL